MSNEKLETEQDNSESRIYRLYEIRDELSGAINNIEEVASQQVELIKVINEKEVNRANFLEFTESLNGSVKEMNAQKQKLEARKAYINEITEVYERRVTEDNKTSSELVDVIVTYTLKALGM